MILYAQQFENIEGKEVYGNDAGRCSPRVIEGRAPHEDASFDAPRCGAFRTGAAGSVGEEIGACGLADGRRSGVL